MENINIRIAVSNDANRWAKMLFHLDQESEFTTFEPGERSLDVKKYENKIVNTLNDPKSTIMFAIDKQSEIERIVGYICAEHHKNNRKSHIVTAGIGVLQSYYKCGVGSKLTSAFLKYAREKEIKRVEVHIAENNYKSINLAKKFGFIIEGIKKNAIRINDTYQNEILMALTF